MSPIVFAMPGNERLARALAEALDAERGKLEIRRFPDGESYVRLDNAVESRVVVVAATLREPDSQFAPLLFLARAARESGASLIVLAAPYLAYLRQDRQFRPGEAVTSRFFAEFVCSFADALLTVDPHLHRIDALSEIYRIPADVVHAASAIGQWVRSNVPSALVIGPDEESRQWVAAVAEAAGAPHVVLTKVRHGDRAVEVSVPRIEKYRDRTPVLVDDIVSTAHTMIEAVHRLQRAGMPAAICIGVHAVFAGSAYEDLIASGARQIVTCNTIEHASNAIDVLPDMTRAVRVMLERVSPQPRMRK